MGARHGRPAVQRASLQFQRDSLFLFSPRVDRHRRLTVCACSRRHTRGHARFGELWFDVVRFVFVTISNVFSFNDSEVRVFV
jgi:hypothetical protein